jgi:hypothetical protein
MNSSFQLPPEVLAIDKRRKRKTKMIIVGVLIGVLLFFTALFFGITKLLESSDAYAAAKAAIENDKEVITATGGTLGMSMSNGSIKTSNGYGEADFSITVDGKEKDVEVFIRLEQEPLRKWEVVEMFSR